MKRMLLAMLIAAGCDDTRAPTECAKVLCADDEYCLTVTGGAPPDSGSAVTPQPVCTAAPDACEGTPSCDCLPECTDCSDGSSGVYCEIAAP